jgi:hypothetical protein
MSGTFVALLQTGYARADQKECSGSDEGIQAHVETAKMFSGSLLPVRVEESLSVTSRVQKQD